MSEVKSGDKVSIHYIGSLEDGTIFDSSEGREPLEFTVGSGMVIPGLDAALPGMKVGEKKTETIPCEQAYGTHHPEGVIEGARSDMPDDLELEIGMRLEMRNPDGRAMPVTVTVLTDESVTVDANHFLAGKTLIFKFEIVSVG